MALNYESWFDRAENKALVAICARNSIRSAGIGGIIWGLINTGLGVVAMADTIINIGLVLLGLIMLATGILAVSRPTRAAILLGAIVSILLLCWNVAVTILNTMAGVDFEPRGLIFPLLIAVVFFKQYRRLGYVKDTIASLESEEVKRARNISKGLFKKKIKEDPSVAQTSGFGACRMQMMPDGAFCSQRKLTRAFHMTKEEVRGTITDLNAAKITMKINHPLGKLSYSFNKKNSEKIRQWLEGDEPAGVQLAEQTPA